MAIVMKFTIGQAAAQVLRVLISITISRGQERPNRLDLFILNV